MHFNEISDEEWRQLAPILSDAIIAHGQRGRPRVRVRLVANAVLWILTTGESWSRLPGTFPSVPTCRRSLEKWRSTGALAEMHRFSRTPAASFAAGRTACRNSAMPRQGPLSVNPGARGFGRYSGKIRQRGRHRRPHGGHVSRWIRSPGSHSSCRMLRTPGLSMSHPAGRPSARRAFIGLSRPGWVLRRTADANSIRAATLFISSPIRSPTAASAAGPRSCGMPGGWRARD